MIVAIDGPAGAGKSTVARMIAEKLDITLIETGAIYRAVGLRASQRGVDFGDEAALTELAAQLKIRFRFEGGRNHVYVDDEDVSDALRRPEVSAAASAVSPHRGVRAALLELQRDLGRAADVVMEGRDIGTVVFPNADHKFFVTASAEERARRRCNELRGKGEDADFDTVLAEIVERDHRDSTRAVAPLRPAGDAIQVDTTTMSIHEVVDHVLALIRVR